MDAITDFEYDAMGQLIKSIDPENNETTHEYNMLGQRVKRTHPDAGETRYEYDPAGNLTRLYTQRLYNSSEFIQYQYEFNRLTAVIYPQNTENNVYYEYYGYSNGNNNGHIKKQQECLRRTVVRVWQAGRGN